MIGTEICPLIALGSLFGMIRLTLASRLQKLPQNPLRGYDIENFIPKQTQRIRSLMTSIEAFQKELEYHIEGELRFDPMSRHIYSVDASIYEVEPIGCILPKRRQDVINTILIAGKHGLTVTARGAGTGIAGGCIGPGVILDTSRHMKQIREIDYKEEWALCEPGVIQDQLNEALFDQGYRLGPDTSTGNRATLGGMVGNNAAGARSLYYGKTVDAVLGVELVLSDGEVLWFEEIDHETAMKKCAQDDSEGRIYRQLLDIKDKYRKEIKERYPKIHRRASGYNLDSLIQSDSINLAKLITGSEGTLGVITRIKIAITKSPVATALVVLSFEDVFEGLRNIDSILALTPMAVELIDRQVIKMGRLSPTMRGKLDWMEGDPNGLLVVEVEGENEEELNHKIAQVKGIGLGYSQDAITDPTQIANVWALRKAGLGLLMGRRSHAKAVAFIEDFAMPPNQLASFIEKLYAKVEGDGKQLGMYGHAGPGCIHIRPFVDMRKEEDLQWMQTLMEEMTDLVVEHGGTLSGEHGDGYLRSWLGERLYGPTIMQAFKDIKTTFDPNGMMNPGKIIPSQDFRENLRMHPGIEQQSIETVMSFKHEGGFEFAVEMCNGNAACRKKEGVMCPSFQASGDERHTTRARAQVLRAAVNGRMPLDDLTSQGVYDVLDLCIECKGCKSECPSQVDMAKMKSEFLHLYHSKHGTPLRTKIFANLPSLNRFISPFARATNWINGTEAAKWVFGKVGITTKRSLPTYARKTFSKWIQNSFEPIDSSKQVVLFNDTFTEYHEPQVGQSAAYLLTQLGYHVIVPPYACCGRTLISKGLLTQAQRKASKLINTLYPYAREGLPIVGLEPSCILTLRDEMPDLVTSAKMRVIVDMCQTLDEFLAKNLPLPIPEVKQSIFVHGHCHQKALVGMDPTLSVLKSIPGTEVKLIDSGCCGMAGAFGYEEEHYDFSMKIGEDRLFPAVRKATKETRLCASGFSCRSQIEHGTGHKAYHLAEILADNLPI
jgi:FAD/FMN-containing dehydrogenase/Fe-S oxidoreductase